MCIFAQPHIHIYTYVYMYIYVYISIHTHAHTRTHYTCIYRHMCTFCSQDNKQLSLQVTYVKMSVQTHVGQCTLVMLLFILIGVQETADMYAYVCMHMSSEHVYVCM